VAGISAKQKMYKDTVNTLKQKKAQQWGKDYLNALETLRAELLPTKQTSIFADETRLREEITQVYQAICFNEAAPSNLQIASINSLSKKVDDAEKKASDINVQYEEKLKAMLKVKK
jgi:hypothetical protein